MSGERPRAIPFYRFASRDTLPSRRRPPRLIEAHSRAAAVLLTELNSCSFKGLLHCCSCFWRDLRRREPKEQYAVHSSASLRHLLNRTDQDWRSLSSNKFSRPHFGARKLTSVLNEARIC